MEKVMGRVRIQMNGQKNARMVPKRIQNSEKKAAKKMVRQNYKNVCGERDKN